MRALPSMGMSCWRARRCSGRADHPVLCTPGSGHPRAGRRAEESADMTQQAMGYEDFDIPLESGGLRVRRWGAAEEPVVVCVPRLSANLCGFDRLAERLAGD